MIEPRFSVPLANALIIMPIEILRFVPESFFFLTNSLVIFLLFVEAIKDLRTEGLEFYFWGVRLFSGENICAEPIEIAMLPKKIRLKNIMESSLANY